MSHPSSVDLEAFACGEEAARVAEHVSACADCAAFIARIHGALAAGPSRSQAEAAVARAATRLDRASLAAPTSLESARANAARRWVTTASTLAIPLAAAAALLLLLRAPSTRETVLDEMPGPTASDPSPPLVPAAGPGVTFKGSVQAAVIRDRAGEQARFTGIVSVRPGDRLRVEVALDREQAILAAVLGEDGSWLELMPEGVRRPGTHFSERATRIDTSPLRGAIFVGSPEAVAHARSTGQLADDVTTIRVEWEAQ